MKAQHIELTRGRVSILDYEDYERLKSFNWHYHKHGYAKRTKKINGKYAAIMLHREVMRCPPNKFVDHIDGNKLDNRKSNLRICSKAENCRNRVRMNGNNTSGFHGVCYNKEKKLWLARIGLDWKRIYIGRFKDKEAAAMAYEMAAAFYFGEFAPPPPSGLL